MCHQTVRQNLSAYGQASGHQAAGPVQEDTGLNHTDDEGDQNQDSNEFSHTQSESVAALDPMAQLEVHNLGFGDNGEKPEELVEPNEGVHGLCFSSTGDFVGFSGPISGCSSGAFTSLHDFHAKTDAAMCPDDAGIYKQINSLSSTHSSDHEDDNKSEIRSPVERSDLFIHVDDSSNFIENGAYSQLSLEPPPCPSALEEFE